MVTIRRESGDEFGVCTVASLRLALAARRARCAAIAMAWMVDAALGQPYFVRGIARRYELDLLGGLAAT